MHVRASVLGILNPNYEFLPFIFIILAPFYVPNYVIDSVIMYTYIMKNVILMIYYPVSSIVFLVVLSRWEVYSFVLYNIVYIVFC